MEKKLELTKRDLLFWFFSAFGCGFGLGMAFIGIVLLSIRGGL